MMSNTGRNTYSLEKLKVRLIMSDREGLEPIRGEELATFNPRGHQPDKENDPGSSGPQSHARQEGAFGPPGIVQREFGAPIITPKSTASGFLYYWTGQKTIWQKPPPISRASTTSRWPGPILLRDSRDQRSLK